jgi:hypothetical protein
MLIFFARWYAEIICMYVVLLVIDSKLPVIYLKRVF